MIRALPFLRRRAGEEIGGKRDIACGVHPNLRGRASFAQTRACRATPVPHPRARRQSQMSARREPLPIFRPPHHPGP